jgi:hypothetical protein
MSDKIKRVTPREIAEMLVNEQAYADTRFVLAEEHEAEIERLRARVAELECVLRDARHNGLIYWEPQTSRGAVERAAMMARIDIVLNLEAQP